jgi:hypothetical protein
MANAHSPRKRPISSLQFNFTVSANTLCRSLIAEVNNEPVAAIFVFYLQNVPTMFMGCPLMSIAKMPAYLLQWEATSAKEKMSVYDLWGAPDIFDESDLMWGHRFKDGGKLCDPRRGFREPIWYKLYSEIIPRVLDVMRSRGKAKTKQSLGGA